MAEPWSEKLPTGTPFPTLELKVPAWLQDILTPSELPWFVQLNRQIGIENPYPTPDWKQKALDIEAAAKEAITNKTDILSKAKDATTSWVKDLLDGLNKTVSDIEGTGVNILVYVALFLILLAGLIVLIMPPKEQAETGAKMIAAAG